MCTSYKLHPSVVHIFGIVVSKWKSNGVLSTIVIRLRNIITWIPRQPFTTSSQHNINVVNIYSKKKSTWNIMHNYIAKRNGQNKFVR